MQKMISRLYLIRCQIISNSFNLLIEFYLSYYMGQLELMGFVIFSYKEERINFKVVRLQDLEALEIEFGGIATCDIVRRMELDSNGSRAMLLFQNTQIVVCPHYLHHQPFNEIVEKS